MLRLNHFSRLNQCLTCASQFPRKIIARNYRNRNILTLNSRGLWNDFFPPDVKSLTDLLISKPQTIYVGIDPTANFLHVGHLPLLVAAFHAQTAGHRVIFVVGEATAAIGDPSGKTKERPHLEHDKIRRNAECLTSSLRRIISNHESDVWEARPENPLTPISILNNKDWYSGMEVVDFVRNCASQLHISPMLSRKSVKSRLESESGSLSLAEFMYQAFQAYDWFHLFRKFNCRIQLGGADQFGNIMTGHDFIKKVTGETVFGITWPLTVDVHGQKMGKSIETAVSLDGEQTSPFRLYQHFLNYPDSVIEQQLKLLTFMNEKEIENLLEQHNADPGRRKAQEKLARQVVTLIHGTQGWELAKKTTLALFHQNADALFSMSAQELETALEGVNKVQLQLSPGISVLDAALMCGAFTWEKKAREIIEAGGLLINNIRMKNPQAVLIPGEHILPSGVSLFRVGKKKFTLKMNSTAVSGVGRTMIAKRPSIDLKKLKTIEDVHNAFDQLCVKEEEISHDLDSVLAQRNYILSKISSVQNLAPNLKVLESEAKELVRITSSTALLADKVSAKVKKLDTLKSRVSAAQQRVQDLLDVQSCAEGVSVAMKNEDFEKAAAYIQRFLTMDEELLKQAAQGSTFETALVSLRASRGELEGLIHGNFDSAVKARDAASVERFFKLFPLIHCHATGLEKFSRYLSAQAMDEVLLFQLFIQIQEKSSVALANLSRPTSAGDKRANIKFADALTVLYEGVARAVEIHQPLVEAYYGPGWLLSLVQTLQTSATDPQGCAIISEFKRSRRFSATLAAVNEALLHPHHHHAGGGGVAGWVGGASEGHSLGHRYTGSGGGVGSLMVSPSVPSLSEEEKRRNKSGSTGDLDPRALDVLVGELTIMNARTELYLRFIRRRLLADMEASAKKKREASPAAKNEKESGATTSVPPELLDPLERFLRECRLSAELQELICHYISMEKYYQDETVRKAVSMDTREPESQTSSMVDDVFFILKKCVRRALSSCSVDGFCAVVNNTSTLLEETYCPVLRSRIKAGFPGGYMDLTQAYNVIQSSIQQGRLMPGSSAESEAGKIAFLTCLNNAEASCEYLNSLHRSISGEIPAHLSTLNEKEMAKVDDSLGSMAALETQLKGIIQMGMDQPHMSAGNYERLVLLLTSEITSQLEKAVLKCSFNRLGGLQLDKDVRALVGYLGSVIDWSIRDKFARLSQMATLLNMERLTEVGFWITASVYVEAGTPNLSICPRALGKQWDGASHLEVDCSGGEESTFSPLGGLQLDKDVRALVGYLGSVIDWSIRDKFARLSQMATLLNMERLTEVGFWITASVYVEAGTPNLSICPRALGKQWDGASYLEVDCSGGEESTFSPAFDFDAFDFDAADFDALDFPPALDFDPPALDFDPPALDLDPPAFDFEPPALDFDAPALDFPSALPPFLGAAAAFAPPPPSSSGSPFKGISESTGQ
ncbi:unnamed protein product [Cyprideis torosa]|uniref:Tyrosine--tRNA ligase n=1 Tax=Cyprideis torosa TaxID=163714 RepID=A0A7R8W7Z4_9CRUS|nr:unnamed protein product [Cyprideis torosa]CAG0882929.1 unnamed protein product [Cyprideis torosa]